MADGTIHLSYPLSFLAGMVSFLSPCVFPLVPVYAGFLGGRATGDGTGRRVPLALTGVAFVLGFTAVFVTLFYVLSALDVTLVARHRREVDLVAGALVVLLGLQTLGVLRFTPLLRERRRMVLLGAGGGGGMTGGGRAGADAGLGGPGDLPTGALGGAKGTRRRVLPGGGLVAAFVLGVTFAAGWTPCIGPQLAAILTVAAQGDFAGLPVMLSYCLGLGIPFLVVALLADRLTNVLRAVNRHLGAVETVGGILLLVFGVLLIAGQLTVLNRYAAAAPFGL